MNVKESHEKYYDEYIDRQVAMGLNHRHFSIMSNLKKHGLRKNHKVLEIGSGIGSVTGLIAKFLIKGSGSILANDLSGKSLEVAKKRLKNYGNIDYLKGDITNTTIQGKFDFIVLPDVLEHIPIEDHLVLMKKCCNLLSDNGKIFIHIPNPFYLRWSKNNTPHLSQELDQPLFTELIINNIVGADLFICYLEDYSIYIKENDYRILILMKSSEKVSFTSANKKPDGFLTKIKRKVFNF